MYALLIVVCPFVTRRVSSNSSYELVEKYQEQLIFPEHLSLVKQELLPPEHFTPGF